MRSSLAGATTSWPPAGPRARRSRALLRVVVLATAASSVTLPLVAVHASAAQQEPADQQAADLQSPDLGAGGGGLAPVADQMYVSARPGAGRFALVADGKAATIVVSSADWPGVVRVAGDLQADLKSVTGVEPAVAKDAAPTGGGVVIVGTIGHSPLVDGLVSRHKLDVSSIKGKWETSIQQVVDDPMPGVRQALVIAGSDQRGTIYGSYDVSKQIGVSPWYWWDDVTPKHQDALYVLPGRHTQGTPAVKYRGFFINDENPALGTWAPATFGPGLATGYEGGFNAKFYAKVFETMLRLKANYLWPAVWGRAFKEDDPQNYATAKLYGVVMGTSHEAPMMRGIEEWNRHAKPAVRDASGNITTPGSDPYGGTGEWSFRRNGDAIKAYMTEGIQNMVKDDIDGVVTLGMRGNGDVSLPDGDGIDLMKTIISTERQIIGDVTKQDVTAIPQVWTLYKEVQRYWDEGLRAPDDVTVVFTDDNWGNVRKYPDPAMPKRSGGYGMYYHFDYVGGGRNYKWVDTVNLDNTWEQLDQAYSRGIDRLWVVNVGDMKNQEEPLQYFLDYSWAPKQWPLNRLGDWERQYAAQNFGATAAGAVADLLHDYGTLQSRRKPELLNRRITLDPAKDPATDSSAVVYDDQASPFSLTNYAELDRATAEWATLAARADTIGKALPASAQAAYYELVGYQVKATANLYALRDAEFTNLLYAKQGRAAANDLAATAEARFADDQAMSGYYNNTLAGGKWKGFQLQPHIDYGDVARYGSNAPWQQPELNNVALTDVIFPAVQRLTLPSAASLGVAIDGSEQSWPAPASASPSASPSTSASASPSTSASASPSASPSTDPVLPTFSPYQTAPQQYLDVFNRGTTAFDYSIKPGVPWVTVTNAQGSVDQQVRSLVSIDWARAPKGTTRVPITVTGANGASVVVTAVVDNPTLSRGQVSGWVEAGGYVSIDADGYTRSVPANGVAYRRIPDLGRTGAAMAPSPATAASQAAGSGPRLEYRTTFTTTGPVKISAFVSPRNNALGGDGLKYAISVDGATPQLVNITTASGANDTTMNRQWERNTSDNVNVTTTTHTISTAGVHTVTFWMIDPTVLLQKLVIDTGGLKWSYLGPPPSLRVR